MDRAVREGNKSRLREGIREPSGGQASPHGHGSNRSNAVRGTGLL